MSASTDPWRDLAAAGTAAVPWASARVTEPPVAEAEAHVRERGLRL